MRACQYFKRLSIQSNKKTSLKPVFLNVIMTDVRPASVQQKLMSFYTLIDRCLNDRQRVNLVVALGGGSDASVYRSYSNYLDKYLKDENFNLVLVKPSVWSFTRAWTVFYAVIYFTRLRGSAAQRINFACLSALSRVRISTFRDIYDGLPCCHWLGLTGGVELPTFRFRRDQSATRCSVSALQFGQASLEQQHFSGYSVDNIFVYDDLSRLIYTKLNMQVASIEVTGSPEFEYHTSLLCNEKLFEEDRLNVLFVDQPVQQRGEYTEEYLQACYTMLEKMNNESDVVLTVKLHPRGSAFGPGQLSNFSIVDDWSAGLSRSHVVIGFFSNLCDLALKSGRVTFYLGSASILDKAKQDWIVSQDGYVTEDIDKVSQIIERLKSQSTLLSKKIMLRSAMESELPSELIFKRMVACCESKAVA